MPIVYKTEAVYQTVIDKYICNKCGKEVPDNREVPILVQSYHCGYYSKIGDGYTFDCIFCEDCFIEMCREFKIPIVVRDDEHGVEKEFKP